MLVNFKNAEVEVWKLRQGVVLGLREHFVHIVSFAVERGKFVVQVQEHEDYFGTYNSSELEWTEPH